MRKGESQKVQRDRLQKIGELALRAFFSSFPSYKRKNFKNPTFEVILASGTEMAALKKNKPRHLRKIAFFRTPLLKLKYFDNLFIANSEKALSRKTAWRSYLSKVRGKDKKVDVLAFRESEDFPLPPSLKIKNNSLGEIYLNWDLKPRDFERLTFLFLHGLVHLLGFSHEKERDMIEMEKIEKKIWRQICFWA